MNKHDYWRLLERSTPAFCSDCDSWLVLDNHSNRRRHQVDQQGQAESKCTQYSWRRERADAMKIIEDKIDFYNMHAAGVFYRLRGVHQTMSLYQGGQEPAASALRTAMLFLTPPSLFDRTKRPQHLSSNHLSAVIHDIRTNRQLMPAKPASWKYS